MFGTNPRLPDWMADTDDLHANAILGVWLCDKPPVLRVVVEYRRAPASVLGDLQGGCLIPTRSLVCTAEALRMTPMALKKGSSKHASILALSSRW